MSELKRYQQDQYGDIEERIDGKYVKYDDMLSAYGGTPEQIRKVIVEPKQESKVDLCPKCCSPNYGYFDDKKYKWCQHCLYEQPRPEAKEDEIFEMLEKLCKKVHELEGQWDDKKLMFGSFHRALYGAIKQARQELARVIEEAIKSKCDCVKGEDCKCDLTEYNLAVNEIADLVRGKK